MVDKKILDRLERISLRLTGILQETNLTRQEVDRIILAMDSTNPEDLISNKGARLQGSQAVGISKRAYKRIEQLSKKHGVPKYKIANAAISHSFGFES